MPLQRKLSPAITHEPWLSRAPVHAIRHRRPVPDDLAAQLGLPLGSTVPMALAAMQEGASNKLVLSHADMERVFDAVSAVRALPVVCMITPVAVCTDACSTLVLVR